MEKLCSTEIDKSEYTYLPNFNVSNIFEFGGNNPDVSYERAYMDTEGNENFTGIIDTLRKYQDRHSQRFSSKMLEVAVLCVMEQEKEEIEYSINNTCDTSFQSPVTKNVQNYDENWSLENRLAASVLD